MLKGRAVCGLKDLNVSSGNQVNQLSTRARTRLALRYALFVLLHEYFALPSRPESKRA